MVHETCAGEKDEGEPEPGRPTQRGSRNTLRDPRIFCEEKLWEKSIIKDFLFERKYFEEIANQINTNADSVTILWGLAKCSRIKVRQPLGVEIPSIIDAPTLCRDDKLLLPPSCGLQQPSSRLLFRSYMKTVQLQQTFFVVGFLVWSRWQQALKHLLQVLRLPWRRETKKKNKQKERGSTALWTRPGVWSLGGKQTDFKLRAVADFDAGNILPAPHGVPNKTFRKIRLVHQRIM
ncbi:hypothetical protein C8J56DRAFT_1033540 [Mycena floridula]|nr:hypothetical protein C8J56DRAFT_1033540 [Mycena floridula]